MLHACIAEPTQHASDASHTAVITPSAGVLAHRQHVKGLKQHRAFRAVLSLVYRMPAVPQAMLRYRCNKATGSTPRRGNTLQSVKAERHKCKCSSHGS
jgi:hypothetical protein